MRELPGGTVTFLFTDVEGSTKLLHELGAEAYARALAEHRRVIREAFARHGGVEVDTQGDAFFVAFPTAPGALAAASEMLEELASGPIRVRMGVHTGTPFVAQEGYVGTDVNRAARIAACGHGGQLLVSASTASLVSADGVRDLGEHRLKDLSAPERIFQLGDGEFPPLKSLHQTNLPVPATPFLGREGELAEIAALLARDDVRLVTLVGPGGTGKTRLALQAAGAAADSSPGGVWWVPLAALRDRELVLPAAAQALGATGDLAEHIGDRRLLLLFDNFEHVAPAAADVSQLLQRCPRLALLVTSREPLRLDGEWEYAVDSLRESEAVELFEARARAVRRGFVAHSEVRQICERLDNLPLAIELAAARVKVLSPAALLERLERRLPMLSGGARDAPERQRTLRATIEWSHELLGEEERRLFARLAVFRGGWTLDAAEEICDADFDTLSSLVDKSLVRMRDGDRFWMLETIREYAVDRLEQSDEADEMRRRHWQYFLALAEEAEPHLRGDPKEWLERLDPEHDNLRAALDGAETAGETQSVLRLVAALSEFWAVRGHFEEADRRIERALAAEPLPTLERARALVAAAHFASSAGDAARERGRAEEALALFAELGDPGGSAQARLALAWVVASERDWATARELVEKSVQELMELGDHLNALSARRTLAWMHEELGDHTGYRQLTEENLELARAVGQRRIEARALGALAMLALEDGRIADATSLLHDSFRIDRDLGNAVFVSVDLARFAAVALQTGDAIASAQLLARSAALQAEIGWSPESWAAEEYEQILGKTRAALHAADFTAAWERGQALDADDAVALVLGDRR